MLLNSIISEVNGKLLLGAFLEVMKEECSNSEEQHWSPRAKQRLSTNLGTPQQAFFKTLLIIEGIMICFIQSESICFDGTNGLQ